MNLAGSATLHGATSGRIMFTRLLETTSREPCEPTTLFIDLGGVQIATASYLRESIFAFKAHMRVVESNFYPAVANCNQDIEDELQLLASAKKDALVTCELNENGIASKPRIIGELDPKQAITYRYVAMQQKATAGSLMADFGETERTRTTNAWNNRLAALVAKGLLREFERGRSKHFKPLIEES